MQAARREVQPCSDFVEPGQRGQGGAQQVAHGAHRVAVTPVERGDAARRTDEEGFERRLVAPHRQIEQVGLEACGQSLRAEARIGGVDQRVVGSVRRPRVGEVDGVERQAAAGEPAGEAVDQAQQPFVGEHAAGIVGIRGERAGLGDAQPAVTAFPRDAHRHVRQQHAQEAGQALQGFFE